MLGFYTKHEALNRPVLDEQCCTALRVGYDAIAGFLRDRIEGGHPMCIAIDGYLGVDWDAIIPRLIARLRERGVECGFSADVGRCLKDPGEIESMLRGCFSNDPNWGRVYDGELSGFFDPDRLERLSQELALQQPMQRGAGYRVAIVYGTGAALPVIARLCQRICYVDLTKGEVLARLDRREAALLGTSTRDLPDKQIARRLAYVDFGVVNAHKKAVLQKVDWLLFAGRSDTPVLMPREAYRSILGSLARSPFRPLPFYFPRVWGGTYMAKHRGLPMERCAFAIEVAPRKQSLRVLVGNSILEIPFLNLIWNNPLEILGRESLDALGDYFPLTLNYDDTYHGGSLALQCHPGRAYMREFFNEFDTHDEMYYLVKAWDGARTYHGLRDGCDLAELRSLAERAEREHIPFDYERYVNSWDSQGSVHDLYLHPAGTLHASGENQLVLEIDYDGSREGQEYTFHLYDYLRRDLDGSLRGIHLDHFFHELRPERTRSWIPGRLKQEPRLLRTDSEAGREYLIGDYHEMHHVVHRLEFSTRMEDDTAGRFHILSLVEGDRMIVRSIEHPARDCEIAYTESVILPAALGAYEIINTGRTSCRVTKALLR